MTQPLRIDVDKSINRNLPTEHRQVDLEGQSFADTLNQQLETTATPNIKFSNHAQKRLEKREIELSDDGLKRLANAVDKAEKRGGRESLVLMDQMAFIVNVKQHLVVTAMDARQSGEGVFTQIDSVVLADKSE